MNPARRNFLKAAGLGLGATLLTPNAWGRSHADEKKLGIALVGLGNYAMNKLAPAFAFAQFCELRGLVTGTPTKAEKYGAQYGIPKENIYTYDNFDQIKDNPGIDIVYVVLPNSMHADYVIRAAEAGKHVICEKPFDVSAAQAEKAVKACEEAGVLLQTGYRCQYDPYHLELMRVGQNEVMGQVNFLRTNFSFYGVNNSNWRFTDKKLSGGGPLMDVGVYCIQGCRYTMGKEPVAVTARSYRFYPDKMEDVEQSIVWQFEFPNGAVADCSSSYVARSNFIEVSAENGNFGLSSAYSYSPPAGHVAGIEMNFPHDNQQAKQMDAFARNILDDTPVVADGLEGLKDMRLIEAIYASAHNNGQRIELDAELKMK
ncbi:MAG: Gfo/Idh/MocA family oxidoreductase [Bacteroidota bacterium]